MTSIMLLITLSTPTAIGLINLWLGLRISRIRLRDQVLIGDNVNDMSAGCMRAHANLVEYAPFVLILMALIEAARGSGTALGAAGIIFVVARRGDDVGPHNSLAAKRKAFTALFHQISDNDAG